MSARMIKLLTALAALTLAVPACDFLPNRLPSITPPAIITPSVMPTVVATPSNPTPTQPPAATEIPAQPTAAAPQGQPGNPGYPAQTGTTDGYPAPKQPVIDTSDHFVLPEESAWKAFPFADQAAKAWRKDAVLVEIVRLRQMESNLGMAYGPQGWFFMFKSANVPTSLVEFYVKISGGIVLGSSEAQPLYSVAPPFKKRAFPLTANLIEGRDALKIYLENGGDAYIKGKGRIELDLRLVFLEGTPNPVWSLFDASDINSPALISIDAITKTVVEDPFAKYIK